MHEALQHARSLMRAHQAWCRDLQPCSLLQHSAWSSRPGRLQAGPAQLDVRVARPALQSMPCQGSAGCTTSPGSSKASLQPGICIAGCRRSMADPAPCSSRCARRACRPSLHSRLPGSTSVVVRCCMHAQGAPSARVLILDSEGGMWGAGEAICQYARQENVRALASTRRSPWPPCPVTAVLSRRAPVPAAARAGPPGGLAGPGAQRPGRAAARAAAAGRPGQRVGVLRCGPLGQHVCEQGRWFADVRQASRRAVERFGCMPLAARCIRLQPAQGSAHAWAHAQVWLYYACPDAASVCVRTAAHCKLPSD